MSTKSNAPLGLSFVALALFIGAAHAASGTSCAPVTKPATLKAFSHRVDVRPTVTKTAVKTTAESIHDETKNISLPETDRATSSQADRKGPAMTRALDKRQLRAVKNMRAKSPLAPLADSHNHISKASMDGFVREQLASHNATVVSPNENAAKFRAVLTRAKSLISDPKKGYNVETYGDDTRSQGDQGTIVINGNNKTVYVPASSVTGPDHRTIVVDCNNCKIVIVGDTKGADDRQITVAGNSDKIVLQGDKANGAAGQAGGTVNDDRQVVADGNRDSIKLGGDQADGGRGRAGKTGQDGGAGGTVTDDRRVAANGTGDSVGLGKDSADGGNGGRGGLRGGDGGNGGDVQDGRTTTANGNGTTISDAGASANGGNGGNGRTVGGNGGNGGRVSVSGGVTDTGRNTTLHPGTYSANGGDGGNGRQQ